MNNLTQRTFGAEIEFVSRDRGERLQSEMRARGLECRIEGYNHVTKRHWKIVTDASVKPNGAQRRDGYCKGLELVSPILQGANGLEQLKTACEALEAADAKVNITCGLHVHHGADDFSIDNFRGLLKLYVRFEETIDELQPASRRRSVNTYCKSIKTVTTAGTERLVDRCETVHDLTQLYRSRFYKLNFHSFATHTTVEFRHHSGTLEFEKISKWVMLTQAMVERTFKGAVVKGAAGSDSWKLFTETIFLDRKNGQHAKSEYAKQLTAFYSKRRKQLAA